MNTLGLAALAILRSKIDETETPPGSNQGLIVRWACERWVSKKRFGELYASGKMAWCAGAVCSALAEAGSKDILKVVSLDCDILWRGLCRQGASVDHSKVQPGDLYFLGSDEDRVHVGFVEEVSGGSLITISGNAPAKGRRIADRVARGRVALSEIAGLARVAR